MFEIIIILLLIIIYVSGRKLKTYINPISLFTSSLLLSVAAVYCGNIFGLLRGVATQTTYKSQGLILLSVLTFLIPWLINFPKVQSGITKKYELRFNQRLLNIILLNLFVMLIGIYFFKGIPLIRMASGQINIIAFNESLKTLPLGLMSIILISSITLSLYLPFIYSNSKLLSKYLNYFLIFFGIVLTLWQGKRQGFLMLIFIFFAYNSLRKKTIRSKTFALIKIILSIIIFSGLFSLISRLRYGSNQTNYLELLQYAIYPVMNFTSVVNQFETFHVNSIIPINVLSGLIPRRILDQGTANINIISYEPSSPSGYLSPWFIDYGLIGVIIGSLLISIVAKLAHKRQYNSENKFRYYLLVLWCCATVGIYDHLLTLNYFLLPTLMLSFFRFRLNRK